MSSDRTNPQQVIPLDAKATVLNYNTPTSGSPSKIIGLYQNLVAQSKIIIPLAQGIGIGGAATILKIMQQTPAINKKSDYILAAALPLALGTLVSLKSILGTFTAFGLSKEISNRGLDEKLPLKNGSPSTHAGRMTRLFGELSVKGAGVSMCTYACGFALTAGLNYAIHKLRGL
jgi:hypothetical protein